MIKLLLCARETIRDERQPLPPGANCNLMGETARKQLCMDTLVRGEGLPGEESVVGAFRKPRKPVGRDEEQCTPGVGDSQGKCPELIEECAFSLGSNREPLEVTE